MPRRRRINRRFLKLALCEGLAICCGLGAVAAFRRGTAAALTLALTLLLGVALSAGAGIAQTRGLVGDLAETELAKDGEDEEDRRRTGREA